MTSNLHNGSLNIQGKLDYKLNFIDVKSLFQKFDIPTLQETCLMDKCSIVLSD